MKSKKIRTKGKVPLSRYFKKISVGSTVGIVKDASIKSGIPGRLVGKSGKVTGSKGASKLVKVKDGKKPKTFIIHPIHLKQLNQGKNKE